MRLCYRYFVFELRVAAVFSRMFRHYHHRHHHELGAHLRRSIARDAHKKPNQLTFALCFSLSEAVVREDKFAFLCVRLFESLRSKGDFSVRRFLRLIYGLHYALRPGAFETWKRSGSGMGQMGTRKEQRDENGETRGDRNEQRQGSRDGERKGGRSKESGWGKGATDAADCSNVLINQNTNFMLLRSNERE